MSGEKLRQNPILHGTIEALWTAPYFLRVNSAVWGTHVRPLLSYAEHHTIHRVGWAIPEGLCPPEKPRPGLQAVPSKMLFSTFPSYSKCCPIIRTLPGRDETAREYRNTRLKAFAIGIVIQAWLWYSDAIPNIGHSCCKVWFIVLTGNRNQGGTQLYGQGVWRRVFADLSTKNTAATEQPHLWV